MARDEPADLDEDDTELCSPTTASPSSGPSASVSVSVSKSLSRITRSVSRAQQARQSQEADTPEEVQSRGVSSLARSLRTKSKSIMSRLQGNLTASELLQPPSPSQFYVNSVQGTGVPNAYGQLLLPSACSISDSYVKGLHSVLPVFQCQEMKKFSVQWQLKFHCQAAIITDLALLVLQEVSSCCCHHCLV